MKIHSVWIDSETARQKGDGDGIWDDEQGYQKGTSDADRQLECIQRTKRENRKKGEQ